MKALRKILVLTFFLCGIQCFAALDSLRFSVRGSVTDKETGKSVPYVRVSLEGTNYSTVTNADGDYVIKSSSKPSSITFSHIGYKLLTLDVPDVADPEVNASLVPDALTLGESYVLDGDPELILLDAIERIPLNFPKHAEMFNCFYRETVQKRQKFIYISEAVMRLYKTSYQESIWGDRVAVEKNRVLVSPRASDTLSVEVMGGPSQCIALDLVKNRDFILNEEELSNYNITAAPPEMIGERMQFVIRLSPAVRTEYALHFAKIYIDRQTLAFTRIEMHLDVSDEMRATRAMLVRKPLGLRFKPVQMSLIINWSVEDGVSRISYVRTTFRFNCDWKKRLFATPFTAISEMVVTDRLPVDTPVPIARSESFKPSETLSSKGKLRLDDDFWKDYNIIEPTESLENAIGKLKK